MLYLVGFIKNERYRFKKERYVLERINQERLIIQVMYEFMHIIYDPHEIRLANEIAETLNDRDSIVLHLQFVRKYKEEYLRRILTKVMSMDERKIRRSRAALYTFLISRGDQHGHFGH